MAGKAEAAELTRLQPLLNRSSRSDGTISYVIHRPGSLFNFNDAGFDRTIYRFQRKKMAPSIQKILS